MVVVIIMLVNFQAIPIAMTAGLEVRQDDVINPIALKELCIVDRGGKIELQRLICVGGDVDHFFGMKSSAIKEFGLDVGTLVVVEHEGYGHAQDIFGRLIVEMRFVLRLGNTVNVVGLTEVNALGKAVIRPVRLLQLGHVLVDGKGGIRNVGQGSEL